MQHSMCHYTISVRNLHELFWYKVLHAQIKDQNIYFTVDNITLVVTNLHHYYYYYYFFFLGVFLPPDFPPYFSASMSKNEFTSAARSCCFF